MDGDIDDVIPYLAGERLPLWKGHDAEFARYVQDAFGVPTTFETITITPLTERGRSGVSVDAKEGAIVFLISHDQVRRKLHISPICMGPIVFDQTSIDRRAERVANDGTLAMAIGLMVGRQLGRKAALELLTPEVH
jgi:hypothetical protein